MNHIRPVYIGIVINFLLSYCMPICCLAMIVNNDTPYTNLNKYFLRYDRTLISVILRRCTIRMQCIGRYKADVASCF